MKENMDGCLTQLTDWLLSNPDKKWQSARVHLSTTPFT